MVSIAHIKLWPDHYNQQKVTIKGWIKNNRDSKKISFLSIQDGSSLTTLQVVYRNDLKNFAIITKTMPGSAIEVIGHLQKSNPQEIIELKAQQIKIISPTQQDYFLQKKEHSLEFLRQKAELRARTNLFQAIFKIRHALSLALHNFFNNEGFVHLHTPILTGNDCEGGGESFTAHANDGEKELFFKKITNLTVSGQLHAEAFAQIYKKIYTFGPTFRADKSNTTLHGSEFWMVEPEWAFSNKNNGIALATCLLKSVIRTIYIDHQPELKYLQTKQDINLMKKLEKIVKEDFTQVTYQAALKLINEKGQKQVKSLTWGEDLKREHELFLCTYWNNSPVFVTDYPHQIKAFYMKQNPDQKTVACFDLLFPEIGEVVGGGEREGDYQKIIDALKNKKISSQGLEWYLDLRHQGYGGSTGFGLGFDRLLMFLTGTKNIRDVIPFYRGFKSLKY